MQNAKYHIFYLHQSRCVSPIHMVQYRLHRSSKPAQMSNPSFYLYYHISAITKYNIYINVGLYITDYREWPTKLAAYSHTYIHTLSNHDHVWLQFSLSTSHSGTSSTSATLPHLFFITTYMTTMGSLKSNIGVSSIMETPAGHDTDINRIQESHWVPKQYHRQNWDQRCYHVVSHGTKNGNISLQDSHPPTTYSLYTYKNIPAFHLWRHAKLNLCTTNNLGW